jgi:hypothetical protein
MNETSPFAPSRGATAADVAFTPSVRAMQRRMGSRDAYARFEEKRGFRSTVDDELAAFIAGRNSAYLATASADGRPYIQHRGGPAGFIRVLGPSLLAFADYAGNRQYISAGNLSENDKAFLFLMDYATAARVKIWGRARFVGPGDPAAADLRATPGEPAAERWILFGIEAWDANCHQHIPRLIDAAEADRVIAEQQATIEQLQRSLAALEGMMA